MKILVIGASKGTGALTVEEALARGHEVTAFSRNPSGLAQHPKLTRAHGDFHQRESVDAAVKGHDAVIITAAPTSLKAFRDNPSYISQGTAHVIAAMKAHGVKRLSILSALGTGASRPLLSWLMQKILVDGILRLTYADHVQQEAMVEASGLDWVIVRPPRLTNGPAKRQYVKTDRLEKTPTAISRADVADFLVTSVDTDTWLRKAVQIGG